MIAPETPAPEAGWGWLLAFALVLFLAAGVSAQYVPNTWLVGDGGFYLNMQKTLTRHGTLDQIHTHPQSWYAGPRDVDDAFSNISYGSSGEWWPKHSYLMPVTALPFYWLFGVPGTLAFNVLMMVVMLVLAYQLARRFVTPGLAAGAAFLTAVAGPFLEYSYNFSHDGFYTALFLGSVLATLHGRPRTGGILYGLCVWAKITNLLLAPVLLAALLHDRTEWRDRLARFAAAAAVPLACFALANWYMFGAPWLTSYQRVLVVSGGELTTASHTSLFTVTLGKGLKTLLFGEMGLVTRYPLSLLGLLGFVPLLAERRDRWLGASIAAVLVLFVLFFARFQHYQERFLFPWFCLSIIPLAFAMRRASDLLGRLWLSPRALGALGASAVLAIAGIRIVQTVRKKPWVMSDRIEDARVFLGAFRCDYFNNMRWSWECVQYDNPHNPQNEFIGVNAEQTHRFGGEEAEGYVSVVGHHTRLPRRLVFPGVAYDDTLVVHYGLDDRSRPPFETEVIVWIGDTLIHRDRVDKRELREAVLDTRPWSGRAEDLIFEVRSRRRHYSRVAINAWVRPAP